RQLRLLAGDGELAEPAVRDAALAAIGIEAVAAGDAEARLEAPFRIVQPGMDDLAVARRGLRADPALLLEHQHLAPAPRQRPRHREPDHARADHHAFDGVGHASAESLSPSPSRRFAPGPSLSPRGEGKERRRASPLPTGERDRVRGCAARTSPEGTAQTYFLSFAQVTSLRNSGTVEIAILALAS